MCVIFSDPHIREKHLDELEEVFKEINYYINSIKIAKNKCHVICIGDYYHKSKLTPLELTFGTRWAKTFLPHFTLIEGNHPKESDLLSSVSYLAYLGVIVLEQYIQKDLGFFHAFTDGSEAMYNKNDSYYIPIEKLQEYKYTFLGHQHNFQKVSDTIYHLGSILCTTWNEVNQKKYIAIITDKLEFVELTSYIPMVDVFKIEDLETLSPKTKVRMVFTDFEYFRNNINRLKQYKTKFKDFTIKNDFKLNVLKSTFTSNHSEDIVKAWLSNLSLDIKNIIEPELQ